MVLDGDYSHAVAIASELKQDLGATIIGVGYRPGFALSRSRRCDHAVLLASPREDRFDAGLLEAIQTWEPDVVVPVGFGSHERLVSLGQERLAPCKALLPARDQFEIATDKTKTYDVARELGILTPADHTSAVEEALEFNGTDALEYPIFLKARREKGGAGTALLRSASDLERMARHHRDLGEEIIYQEVIGAEPYTYAYCGLFQEGEPALSFQHIELRSVPRHGGSGTRMANLDDRALTEAATRLLAALKWTGIVQVEFKRNALGQLVLMEVNPKFWASYAFASRLGYRFATHLVAGQLGLDVSWLQEPKWRRAEMVFPVRELSHAIKHRRTESLAKSLLAILWPPAKWDVELGDLRAYLPARLARGSRARVDD